MNIVVNNKYTIRSWGDAKKYMQALAKLISKKEGTYIFSNSNVVSVENYIYQIAKSFNIDKSNIRVISRKKIFDKKAPNNSKLLRQIGISAL